MSELCFFVIYLILLIKKISKIIG